MTNHKCNVFRRKNTPDNCMKRVCTEDFKCDTYYCEYQHLIVAYDLNSITTKNKISKFAEYDQSTQVAANYR